MLAELRICDLAIIDTLQLSFGPGFSVLTGETGAGKSIIIDAVALVLGGRADGSVVRAGSDRALVEATFRLSAERQRVMAPVLLREGMESDDPAYLMLAREVRLEGRNVCRVNGRSVTLSLLRELATGLVDIHGQSEHLSLLHARNQLDLLDRYADLLPLRSEVADLVRQTSAVRAELESLSRHEQELAYRVDLLRFQISEIESALLREGEDDELLAERVRLSNAEQLSELVAEVLTALEEAGDQTPSVLDLLGTGVQALTRLARIDSSLTQQLRAAEATTYQVEELVERLRGYLDEIEFNPQRLQAVEDRLNIIHRLERKYGKTIGEVLDHAVDAADQLDRITHSEERVAELEKMELELLKSLGDRASALSEQRRGAAGRLSASIDAELGALRLEGARFGVSVRWRPDAAGVRVLAKT
ncbi:MAG: AAA family ATPase, partial [Anaerolineae bacterium]|nr:AAA family ATPase [Anaerolineae bacterium]